MVFVTMPKHYKVRVNCIYLFAIYFEYLLQYVLLLIHAENVVDYMNNAVLDRNIRNKPKYGQFAYSNYYGA